MIVYKYLHPERTNVLEEGLIRFTQSAALNDPFETTPNMEPLRRAFREYALRRISETTYPSLADKLIDRFRIGALIKKHFDEFQRNNTNNYAILSLSKTNSNLLMWAHYCDSHHGFVVGFDSTHPFFQTRRPRAFSVLEEISYSDNRPVIPAPDAWDGSTQQIEGMLGSENLATLLLFTKSSDWAYEHELRMVANPSVADFVKRAPDGLKMYLYRFPMECVREVILGIRMPDKDRRRIAVLVKERYPQAQIFRAELNDAHFDVNIVPFA